MSLVQEQPKAAPAPAQVHTVEEVKAEIVRVFGQRAEIALCIAQNESGFQEKVTGPKRLVNGRWVIGNTDKWKSLDRGIYQLNNHWHAEVTDAEAYDAKTNIAEAYRISQSGTTWSQWSSRHKCGV